MKSRLALLALAACLTSPPLAARPAPDPPSSPPAFVPPAASPPWLGVGAATESSQAVESNRVRAETARLRMGVTMPFCIVGCCAIRANHWANRALSAGAPDEPTRLGRVQTMELPDLVDDAAVEAASHSQLVRGSISW